MKERIKQAAIHALAEGFDGVLGLMNRWGQLGPYLFRDPRELDKIETDAVFRLAKTIALMIERRPDLRIAAVVRGCDVRALKEREAQGEINTEGLRIIGVVCSPEQADICNCQKPVYNTFNCTGCWKCMEACPEEAIERINVCPVLAPSQYDVGLRDRKAIYIPYPQAVPLKAMRDMEQCLKITGEMDCKGCENICQANAIQHEDAERLEDVQVGSVILAPGSDAYDPTGVSLYGFGRYPNVVTSMQFERILSASGPYGGHIVRLSDHQEPRRMAWLQCVGSRDLNKASHEYCSSVCCMYAIKEAMIAKEHVPELEISIFFMDMRTYGKEFERYFERAKEIGIKFYRCRVHSLEPVLDTDNIYFRYIDEHGKQIEDEYDMVVLSVGLCTPGSVVELAERAGVQINDNRFAVTPSFAPLNTNRPGIFVCGTFSGPKDIPQTVTEASAAAAEATVALAGARNTLTRKQEFPPERDVTGEEPRVGVFVCHCGSNIAGVVDVEAVADYAQTLPNVVHVERNLFTCSQDTQEVMTRQIQEKGLNRIVVAACSPRTHEPLFRETLKSASLNEYLFEMANIRNQDSWVHAGQPKRATDKAKDLVRMAVAKVNLLSPLPLQSVQVNRTALVIGGGLAGMAAALSIADHGYPVHLVEKTNILGGHARHVFKTYKGEDIGPARQEMEGRVMGHPLISLHLSSTVTEAEGYVGNFKSTISSTDGPRVIEHGIAVVATGARGYEPVEYGYNQSEHVFTAIEFDKLHMMGDRRMNEGKTFVFIQCVGSREPDRMYCSRVCCTHAVQAAIQLKTENPEREVIILYRDIRTYGEREKLFKKARAMGVVFIHYELDQKPRVKPVHQHLEVTVWDHVIHEPLVISADIVVLGTAIVPNPANEELARIYKVPVDTDGFFLEAHQKLRPVDFSSDGLFVAGMAHYPKPVEEAIAQAKAAASRAMCILAQKNMALESTKATVVPENCDGCALCLDVCPYGAISLIEEILDGRKMGRISVNVANCKGCGMCQATCPKDGVYVAGFSLAQIGAQIDAALAI